MLRSPERHVDPAGARRVDIRAERAPDAGGREVDLFIADERRAVDRRAVIFTTERTGIEQPDAAFLARVDRVLFAFVVEDRTGDVHVEIAFPEPRGIRRREPVLQLERLRG